MVFIERGQPSQFDPWGMEHRITDLTNVTKFFGVAMLIVGGIISALGFIISTQLSSQNVATTQTIVAKSVSPKSIALGNTLNEVQSVMGNPIKIINLGTKVIHIYDDMKIIYDDGKVSDVKLT